MIRKLKFLGLALVAVFAMSAVGASAASAAVEFHSENAPITLTGNQEGTSNGFDVQFGEVKCTTAKYHSKTATIKDETTIEVTPTFEGCTFAGVASPIDMNNCTFLLHINNESKGTADVKCAIGSEITVTGGTKCTVHVPAQTGVGPITYKNSGAAEGSTREVTLNLGEIANITYNQTAGTAAVGKCSSMEKSDGKYTGTAEVTGETEDGKSHTGIFIK